MINPAEVASIVIGSTGGATAKKLFRLDTKTYDWVKGFVRDRKIRKSIQSLRQEIIETQAWPIHKSELKADLKGRIDRMNEFRRNQLAAVFGQYQERKTPMMFTELFIGEKPVLAAPFLPFFISISDEEMDAILSKLPAGRKQAEIEKRVGELNAEITTLEGILATELNVPERWFYRDDGLPIPYPAGCRWTAFVQTWEKVAARFNGVVNIEGHSPVNSDESAAYFMLGLENIFKLTPLQAPH